MPQAQTGNRGFSILEIEVVLAVLALFLAIGIPNYLSMRGNNAVRVAEKMVVSDIKRARDLASTQGSGTINLSTPLSGGQGIRITDANGKISWQEALPFGATLTTDWGNNAIVFAQNGTANLGGAATGTITIAHPSASLTKKIQIVQFTGAAIEL